MNKIKKIVITGSLVVVLTGMQIHQRDILVDGPLHKTRISIPEKNRVKLISLLNNTLSSATDLYAQSKQAHWNIKGPSFIALHTLLDDIAHGIQKHVDIIAERTTALGGTALGSIQQTVNQTQLAAYPRDLFKQNEVLSHMIKNIALLGGITRNLIKESERLDDYVTSDIYISFTKFLDKQLWLLEAHLQ